MSSRPARKDLKKDEERLRRLTFQCVECFGMSFQHCLGALSWVSRASSEQPILVELSPAIGDEIGLVTSLAP